MPNLTGLRDHRIDVVRGVAILLVLVHHFHLAYGLGSGLLFRNGNYGVIIFFAISGYLITSTSLRRFGSLNRISLRAFYTFRIARIYPCLLLVLAAITIPGLADVSYFASTKPVPFWLADLSVLTFWHNVLMSRAGYFNYGLNVLWSLSVEEVFYLCFPLLCVTLRSKYLIGLVWIAVVVYAPFYRAQDSSDDIHFLYASFSCFDAIALGCLAAVLARPGRIGAIQGNLLQIASAAGMAAVFFYSSIGGNVFWGPSLISASAAVFLLAEGSTDRTSGLQRNPMAWLGQHSYELYLFHIVVLAAMRNVYDRGDLPVGYKWLWFTAYLAASALVAWLVARWFSEPLNRQLRAWLNPRLSWSAARAT